MDEFDRNMRTTQCFGGGIEVATTVVVDNRAKQLFKKYDLNVPEAVKQFKKDFAEYRQGATPLEEITTIDEARDVAISYSNWVPDEDLSYGELLAWQTYFEAMVEKFPELHDEFVENAVI